jgi:hypothetical protein
MDYIYDQIVSLVTMAHINHLQKNAKADISRFDASPLTVLVLSDSAC